VATVIVDSRAEYIWNVPDNVLSGVLEYVMQQLDSTSPFYDLLYASKLSGNLEFHRLGEQQRTLFEDAVKKMHGERQSQLNGGTEEQAGEVKKIQQLVGLIDFAKSL
jgi:DNA phosphorothioation-dependent restriction protein DptG